ASTTTAVVRGPTTRPPATTPPPDVVTPFTPTPMPTTVTATVAPAPARVATAAPVRRATPEAAAVTPAPVVRRPAPEPGAATPSSRYEAMARDYAANPNANFAVQFAIVCEPSNVTKAVSNGGTNVWFVPISIKGRACYRMYWGRYGTRDEAERGMAALPASLRESKPAVVTISR
ncbi:MAG: hypothetical protein ACXW3E_00765, partial [Thermoanaerobaculia bacterium]